MAMKDELLEKAMDLSPEEREELAYKLLESVEGEASRAGKYEKEWSPLLLRRLEDLRFGRVKGVDGFQALARIRANLEERARKAARRSRSSSTRKRSKK